MQVPCSDWSVRPSVHVSVRPVRKKIVKSILLYLLAGTKINGRPVAKGDWLCSRAPKSLYLVAHLAIKSSRRSYSSFIDQIFTGAIH